MASRRRVICSPAAPAIWILGALLASPSLARAQSAYIRVNQVGYEAGNTPFRAYLMSAAPEDGVTFRVISSEGKSVYSSQVGSLLGIWSNSRKLSYQVYALDFTEQGCRRQTTSKYSSGLRQVQSTVAATGRPSLPEAMTSFARRAIGL